MFNKPDGRTILTWPPQRRINIFNPVRRSDDDDLATVVEAVNQGQQCRNDGRVDLPSKL
jgi:hypothetical protein